MRLRGRHKKKVPKGTFLFSLFKLLFNDLLCHSALVGGDADQVDASPELAHVQRFGLFLHHERFSEQIHHLQFQYIGVSLDGQNVLDRVGIDRNLHLLCLLHADIGIIFPKQDWGAFVDCEAGARFQVEILFPFVTCALVAGEVGEEVQGGHAVLCAAPDINLLLNVIVVFLNRERGHVAIDVAVIYAVVQFGVVLVDGAEESEVLAVRNLAGELDDTVAVLDVPFHPIVTYKTAAMVCAGYLSRSSC